MAKTLVHECVVHCVHSGAHTHVCNMQIKPVNCVAWKGGHTLYERQGGGCSMQYHGLHIPRNVQALLQELSNGEYPPCYFRNIKHGIQTCNMLPSVSIMCDFVLNENSAFPFNVNWLISRFYMDWHFNDFRLDKVI